MRVIKGNLKMLGASTVDVDRNMTTYSVVEIGNTHLPNVRCPTILANYVSRGIDQNGETTLCIQRYFFVDSIRGVELPDGSFFTLRTRWWLVALYIIIGIPLLAILFMGAIPLILALLESMGGQSEKLLGKAGIDPRSGR